MHKREETKSWPDLQQNYTKTGSTARQIRCHHHFEGMTITCLLLITFLKIHYLVNYIYCFVT